MSLNGDSFTTTSQKFAFFPVTNGANCIMFGPGLLSNCAIKEEVISLVHVDDSVLTFLCFCVLYFRFLSSFKHEMT